MSSGRCSPLQGIFLVWRLLAVGSSLYDPALPRPGRRDVLPIALILLIVIVPQAYGGYATEAVRETADEVFEDAAPVAVVPVVQPRTGSREPVDPAAAPERIAARLGVPVGQPDRAPGDRPDHRRRRRASAGTRT